MSRILIVEDDVVLARALKNWLERERLQVTCAITAANARRIIANEEVDMILSDLRLPDGDGIELLEWMKKNKCRIPLIIMTQHAEVSSAIRAMKAGAEDYLPKPIHPETLYPKLNDVLLRTRKTKRKQTDILQRVSPPIREVERRARLVAVTDMSVLIRGENGSGKELVADLIHRTSARDDKPFVPVDCGAIPKELSAAEFFGYVKGAFTGAVTDKTGVFHAADGGTLFLDEVGNLPYEVQTNLLRVLQERRYRPIGGRREYACDVRIVAATNENIERAIAEGHFREDLYHRLQRLDNPCPLLLLNLQRITFHAARRGQIQVGLVDCSGHRKQGCTTNRVTQFPHVARPAVVLQPFDGGRSKSGYSSVVLFTELCEEKLCQRQNVVRTLPKGR